MRKRAGLLIALIIAGLITVIAPAGPAWACSCVAPDKVESLIDLRVIGTVTEVTDHSIQIAVESVQKGGPIPAGALRIGVSPGEASCGYDFVAGRRYSVSSITGKTGLCSGNQPLPGPPSLAPLTSFPPAATLPPTATALPVAAPPPATPARTSYRWPAGAGILLLLTVGLAALAVRRRRG